MTEEQRRALFALREALRLCQGAGFLEDVSKLAIWQAQVEQLLAAYPDTPTERYLGGATQEAAFGGNVSWRFRVVGLGVIRWTGNGNRNWWDTEAKRREVQLLAKGGRTFRLDFATSQVYEVLQ